MNRSLWSFSHVIRVVWLAGLLAHYDHRMEWFEDPFRLIASLSVLVAILFTTRILVFWGALLIVSLAIWTQLPLIDNHWFFALFLNLFWMAWLLPSLFRSRLWGSFDDVDFEKSFPFVRGFTLILYGFSAFYKFNEGFLDPQLSCGIELYRSIQESPLWLSFPAVESLSMKTGLMGAILALEISIPLLLFFRRTWFLGIVMAVIFHLLTSALLRHFPAVIWAPLLCFMPTDIQLRILKNVAKLFRKHAYLALYLVAVSLLMMVGVLVFGKPSPLPADLTWRWPMMRLGSLQWLGMWLALFIWSRPHQNLFTLRAPSIWRFKRLSIRSAIGMLLVLLFFLNGLSPVLGLKTSTSFAMYSNLQTTEGGTNHFVLSSNRWRLFPYADEFVEIESTNSPILEDWKLRSSRIASPMFRRRFESLQAQNPEKKYFVSLRVGNQSKDLETFLRNENLRAPSSYLERKIVYVHDLPLQGHASCQW